MTLTDRTALVTGAASGIGRCVALELAAHGAQLALVDRDAVGLETVADETRQAGATTWTRVQDLSQLDDVSEVVAWAEACMGSLDLLVNNAGLLSFTPVEFEDPDSLRRMFDVNVLAPIMLCRAAVPRMSERGHGRIVNVGSIFGSIAFAYFASYSSTKFALRGYSEALRRELDGTGVGVTYVAPRATRTGLSGSFGRMAAAVGMPMDAPEDVARRVVAATSAERSERYLGTAEPLFVRLNGLLPRLVDWALRKQNRRTRPFAVEAAGATRPARLPTLADLPQEQHA